MMRLVLIIYLLLSLLTNNVAGMGYHSSGNDTIDDICSVDIHIQVDVKNDTIFNGASVTFAVDLSFDNITIEWMNTLHVTLSCDNSSYYILDQNRLYNAPIFCPNITNITDVILSVNASIIETNINITIHPCEWPFIGRNCSFALINLIQCLTISDDNLISNDCNNNHMYSRSEVDLNHRQYFDCVECTYDGKYAAMKSPYLCVNVLSSVYGFCPMEYTTDFKPITIDFSNLSDSLFCGEHREGRLCGRCSTGYGVPINNYKKCVDCSRYYYSWLIFIFVQILPVTVIVILIVIFNIQLTNGSINGVFFYYQLLATIQFALEDRLQIDKHIANSSLGTAIKVLFPPLFANFFNLDFTSLLYNYPICITPDMTPLGAISFQYVIGFYPLVFLSLLYGWIMLYYRGFKCVMFVTRPIHHRLARFWRIAKIEPSLLHSFASVYILCFTQLASTSFLLLHFGYYSSISNSISNSNVTYTNQLVFFYDGSYDYFGWPHFLFGSFAILVVTNQVIFSFLWIIYPFKLFHKLLEALHLRKQIIISLGDVFTGAYKNGSDGTFDYQSAAGLFLISRIVVFLNYFSIYTGFLLPFVCQGVLMVMIEGMILIFRPYRKNIHNFSEFLLCFFLNVIAIGGVLDALVYFLEIPIFNSIFIFLSISLNSIYVTLFVIILFLVVSPLIILLGYIVFCTVMMIKNCCLHCKSSRQRNPPPAIATDDIDHVGRQEEMMEFPDRLENPNDYDERHVQAAPYENYRNNQ